MSTTNILHNGETIHIEGKAYQVITSWLHYIDGDMDEPVVYVRQYEVVRLTNGAHLIYTPGEGLECVHGQGTSCPTCWTI